MRRHYVWRARKTGQRILTSISTGARSSPMSRIFLDTSYVVALVTPKDRHHSKAVELAERLKRQGFRMVTTRAVILEIGNSLAKKRHRPSGVAMLEFLEHDPQVEI